MAALVLDDFLSDSASVTSAVTADSSSDASSYVTDRQRPAKRRRARLETVEERLKHEQRKLRNRQSAAVSRKKKRERVQNLERSVHALNQSNALLLAKLVQVQAERNWFEARYGSLDTTGDPVLQQPTAQAAGAKAIEMFEQALHSQQAMVDAQEDIVRSVEIMGPSAASTTASAAAARPGLSPVDAAVPHAQAVNAALSLSLAHARHSQPTSTTIPSVPAPVPAPAHAPTSATRTLLPSSNSTPRAAASPLSHTLTSSFDPSDRATSRSETHLPGTYPRESTVFALFIATLALLPEMLASSGFPACPSVVKNETMQGVCSKGSAQAQTCWTLAHPGVSRLHIPIRRSCLVTCS